MTKDGDTMICEGCGGAARYAVDIQRPCGWGVDSLCWSCLAERRGWLAEDAVVVEIGEGFRAERSVASVLAGDAEGPTP